MRALLVLVACLTVAGCGGGDGGGERTRSAPAPAATPATPAAEPSVPPAIAPAAFTATRNTTRVAGASPVADAAATALAAFPAERPHAVSLANVERWPAAISAAQLLADPIGAPVLLVEGTRIPPVTQTALDRLGPTGLQAAGGAAVLRVATQARPAGLAGLALTGRGPAAVARAIDRLRTKAAGSPSRAVVVASEEAPAYAMPAASWAAKSGDPVLWVTRDAIPGPTRRAIADHGRPRIYVLGPERVISAAVLRRLGRLGPATRIAGKDAIATAIAFARFADGGFGWGVTDPGHGLAFASTDRPADAAAAAPLATTGSYAPLLLLDRAGRLPEALRGYLLDIQPGYDRDPVRGVYNHGWLMGDASVISPAAQARIDALLEIQPVRPPTE